MQGWVQSLAGLIQYRRVTDKQTHRHEFYQHAMNMDSFQATTSASFCYTSQKLASPMYWETYVTSWASWSSLTGWTLAIAAELHGAQNSFIAIGRRLVANEGSLNTCSPTALQFIKRWKVSWKIRLFVFQCFITLWLCWHKIKQFQFLWVWRHGRSSRSTTGCVGWQQIMISWRWWSLSLWLRAHGCSRNDVEVTHAVVLQ